MVRQTIFWLAPLPKTIFSGAHQSLVEVLIEARHAVGLKQAELGARIGKDQTYISLIERSQRRVDVIEFCALAKAMGIDPQKLFASVVERLPPQLDI